VLFKSLFEIRLKNKACVYLKKKKKTSFLNFPHNAVVGFFSVQKLISVFYQVDLFFLGTTFYVLKSLFKHLNARTCITLP
jgi:hypothetical protein